MIKIGNLDIDKLYLGTSDNVKVYLGNVKLYPSEQPSFQGKWLATYTAGTTSSADCDSTSAITQNEINITDLQSVIIGDCVTSIGDTAFYGCTSLTSIDIPSGVTSIGSYTFSNCTSLTSIDIPSGVTSIGGGAFYGCTSLTSIDIPSGVTSIGSRAFSGCTSLTSITVNATTPPTLANANAFNNTNDCPIYVPSSAVNTYKTASIWTSLASRIQAIPSPYQWVTFTNGDTIPSDLDVYGVSGISQDLLDTYGSSNLNVQFSPSRNWVEYYIYDSGGLNCKSGAELATDPMEIIFSEVSCIDYFNQGATVSGTIQLYIYT